MFQSIKTKILASVTLVVILAFAIMTLLISQYTSERAYQNAYQQAELQAVVYNQALQQQLEQSLGRIKAFALTFAELAAAGGTDRALLDEILKKTVTNQGTKYLGAWMLWEPNAFDGLDNDYKSAPFHDSTGRVNAYWHWDEAGNITHDVNIEWQGAVWYDKPRELKKPTFLEPYIYEVNDKEQLVFSLAAPIFDNEGQFLGIVGLDYDLNTLTALIVEQAQDQQLSLLATDGLVFAGHELGQVSNSALAAVKAGQSYIETITAQGQKVYRVYTPFNIADAVTNWSLVSSINVETLQAPSYQIKLYIGKIAAVALGLLLILLVPILNRLVFKPVTHVTDAVKQIGQHNYQVDLALKSQDEIGQLGRAIQTMSQEIAKKTDALAHSEEMVRQINTELEQRVDDRTQDLRSANESLVIAKQKADQANRAKSEFLANMSHEIRTPLNGIKGLYHLLNETPLNDEQQELLDNSAESAELLLTILNDILDFSKIEAGQISYQAEETELHTLVQQVINLSLPLTQQKLIEFNVEIDDSAPAKAQLDPLRVRQILLNLLSNAIKFTEQGSVLLAVTVESDNLVFTVNDTGIGMTASQLANIFKPFMQADAGTTKKFGGTGLGLSISQQLAELMSGKISIESEPGVGTVCTLSLPLISDRPDQASNAQFYFKAKTQFAVLLGDTELALKMHALLVNQQVDYQLTPTIDEQVIQSNALIVLDVFTLGQMTEQELAKLHQHKHKVLIVRQFHQQQVNGFIHIIDFPITPFAFHKAVQKMLAEGRPEPDKSTTQPQDLTGIRVLLADDIHMNRLVAKRILAKLNAEVGLANNGVEVLGKVAEAEFDVVLMDLHMPEMDGLVATKQLKSNPAWADIPVIGLTADAQDETKQTCLTAGMVDFIVKPFEPQVLVEKIQRSLKSVK
ncbi:response regulator [Catenovulum sp. SM1970]|uniref:ATP-binding protein n=1 Tax=Marinifaba aquimaris TaxID=2741323 RepID=UPI001572157C|nr:ATP-binding protein [Marinifaba aquimaris]NTS75781.1 response regulator [Marinifaba aquimaris]